MFQGSEVVFQVLVHLLQLCVGHYREAIETLDLVRLTRELQRHGLQPRGLAFKLELADALGVHCHRLTILQLQALVVHARNGLELAHLNDFWLRRILVRFHYLRSRRRVLIWRFSLAKLGLLLLRWHYGYFEVPCLSIAKLIRAFLMYSSCVSFPNELKVYTSLKSI